MFTLLSRKIIRDDVPRTILFLYLLSEKLFSMVIAFRKMHWSGGGGLSSNFGTYLANSPCSCSFSSVSHIIRSRFGCLRCSSSIADSILPLTSTQHNISRSGGRDIKIGMPVTLDDAHLICSRLTWLVAHNGLALQRIQLVYDRSRSRCAVIGALH